MMKQLPLFLLLLLSVLAAFLAEAFFPEGENRIYHHAEAADAQYCETVPAGQFCTHLPLVRIDTHGAQISQDLEILASLEIVDNDGGHNHLDSPSAVATDTLIKIRGNSSSLFDKKQYRLTFVDSGLPNPQAQDLQTLAHVSFPVMGMPSDSEWILNGPFLDKTLMRNYLMYNLSGEIMGWAPNVRYCEVILNGEYQGLYLMMETVKVTEHRLKLSPTDPRSYGTSYLVVRERIGDTRYPLNTFGAYAEFTENELGIVYPGPRSGRTPAQLEYIRQDISAFEKMLYSLDYDHPQRGYKNAIDVQSFVDYFIISEFSMNGDSGSLSSYVHKDTRSKLVMGPVWDFNNTFDNYEDLEISCDYLCMIEKPWYDMLLKDEQFVNDVIKRYRFLRQTVLREEKIFGILDDTVAFLGPAIDRNEAVWGYSYGEKRLKNIDRYKNPISRDRNPESFSHAVQMLKETIHSRGDFLDAHIDILKQFCAESTVKKWN